MRDLAGRTAIVTGASRGLGENVAHALAAKGMKVVLAARSEADLKAVEEAIKARGGQAASVITDVRDAASLAGLLAATESHFGPPDVLVNNAGVEGVHTYHRQPIEEIEEVVETNLLGTMRLTRLVLPGMIERRRGHIVNMSSLAGKYGPAYAESYAATKAGMIGFTQALRGSLRGTGVSASVICPGFVDAGMYARNLRETGVSPPATLGVIAVEKVSAAVVKAIEQDVPEVIVNARPVRFWLAMVQIAPGVAEKLFQRIGAKATTALFREAAEIRERQRQAASAESTTEVRG